MATGKLKEIEEAATRVQTKRFNDYFEEQEYNKSKLKGEKTSVEVVSPALEEKDKK